MKKHTLKRILALVGKYPFSLLAVILFAAAEVAATLYVPVLVGDGVDLIAGKGNVNFEELKIVFYKIGVAISRRLRRQMAGGYFQQPPRVPHRAGNQEQGVR